jgi:putative two-component system response regulator
MLALSCEARDRDTGAHIRRIEHICTAFAQELGLSDRKIEDIAYASMLHDIGKVKIPDNILKKPGQLSPDEWTIMKKHTLFGFELLEKKKIFQTARHITRFHHERWDGTGYPDGLVEDQIPLAARICAVADVYDALTHKRVYKEAWLEEEAFEDMRNKFGNHFDPQLKPIFEKLYYNRILHRFAKQFRDQEKYE